MNTLRTSLYGFILLFCLLPWWTACDDMHDFVESGTPDEVLSEAGTAELYVLSEGLFNLNNSSLMRYSFFNSQFTSDYFRQMNRRGLGDTANDIALYGSKMYIVVDVSNQVEVVDYASGLSLRRIPMLNDEGSSRQPRYISFYENKAYVCAYDGTVCRIDTTSLAVDAVLSVGSNPDGICVQQGKLYVSNSGGLDNPHYDNTVSVIDLTNFTRIKDIVVGSNPGKLAAAEDGFVYVVVRNDKLLAIDSRTDQPVWEFKASVIDFDITGRLAYLSVEDADSKLMKIKILNLDTHQIETEHFVTDGTTIQTPYAIAVNPYSGNIYIADAYNYQVKGDVLCFNPQGQLQFRLSGVGINPTAFVFCNRAANPGQQGGNESQHDGAFADRVLEYRPAPSQFMNTAVMAYKDGYDAAQVLAYANELIRNRSLLSLGSFGGSITLGFNHRIPNVKDAYDFRIYGNAAAGSSEPGIVMVSRDDNGNGLPDDEWYELAGSEHTNRQTIRNYAVTYYRPALATDDVRWTDDQGGSGTVPHNTAYSSNSYYPLWQDAESLTFTGTKLPGNATVQDGTWVLTSFAWGYADNLPNSSEGSSFKIDWATDADGNAVTLDGIDFVRIYTAVQQVCGWLGDTSTEISTIEDLHYSSKQ